MTILSAPAGLGHNLVVRSVAMRFAHVMCCHMHVGTHTRARTHTPYTPYTTLLPYTTHRYLTGRETDEGDTEVIIPMSVHAALNPDMHVTF